ncbi:hypothetical protein ACN28E_22535 [Archangium lansingense]|uniref:hypothetical protein n=1 Tax=Archangium lansingense TaxID=2995310 RepID=UPI003B80C03B
MNAWVRLEFDDPRVEPARAVLAREESAGVRYRIPADFSPYDAVMADEILELQERVLGAFRTLVPPGERLAVIDPEDHHPPLLFDPHVPFEKGASREALWGYKLYVEPAWTVGLLPDGDSWCFVGPDFTWEARYLVTRPSELVIRGSRLLSTLDLESLRLLKRFEREES